MHTSPVCEAVIKLLLIPQHSFKMLLKEGRLGWSMERAPDCSSISLDLKMYPCNNCRSMWHKRQLIVYSALACMEDFHPLINHGFWHLKIDTAETAVVSF